MKTKLWSAALVAAMGLTLPAIGRGSATDDAKDTASEHSANAKKTMRHAKPGGESAADHKADAKDTASATKSKSEKKARHAKDDAKDAVHDATK